VFVIRQLWTVFTLVACVACSTKSEVPQILNKPDPCRNPVNLDADGPGVASLAGYRPVSGEILNINRLEAYFEILDTSPIPDNSRIKAHLPFRLYLLATPEKNDLGLNFQVGCQSGDFLGDGAWSFRFAVPTSVDTSTNTTTYRTYTFTVNRVFDETVTAGSLQSRPSDIFAATFTDLLAHKFVEAQAQDPVTQQAWVPTTSSVKIVPTPTPLVIMKASMGRDATFRANHTIRVAMTPQDSKR
jgi:hypothetical protein